MQQRYCSLSLIENQINKWAIEHENRHFDAVSSFREEVERKYREKVEEACLFLVEDGNLSAFNQKTKNIVEQILKKNSWVGWELCDLGPVLNISVPEHYVSAMVVYNALHFLDDGIDGHQEYGHIKTQSYYGFLNHQGFNQRESSAVSGMVGMGIINYVLSKIPHSGSAISANILRLIQEVYLGMLCESMCEKPFTLELYTKIIKRKALAYQVILDHTFLYGIEKKLKTKLLEINSKIIEIGQLTDDLIDWEDDLKQNNFSICFVENMTRESLIQLLLNKLDLFKDLLLELEDRYRNVNANRVKDWVKLLKTKIDKT